MKLKFLTSLIAAGVMLVGTSAFALTDAQKAAINSTINAASIAEVPSAAANALKTCNCDDDACIQFVVNAAKAKLGPNASIASVRGLVNSLVLACPIKAPAIVQYSGSAFPGMKANIAAAAQSGLATAASNGSITSTQANSLSASVNQAAGIAGAAGAARTGGSLFQANQVAANAAARTEFQRSNQNNYAN